MMFLLLLAVRRYVGLYANSTRWTRGMMFPLRYIGGYAASWIPIWITRYLLIIFQLAPPLLAILLLYQHTQGLYVNG